MMIGPLIMGTTSGSGGGFGGFIDTPDPMYIGGDWWSFTPTSRATAPSIGIISRKSTDNGVTWIEDNTTWHTAFITGTEHYINNISADVQGSFVNHKDLGTPATDWIFTNVSNPPGGFIVGGFNLLHTDNTNNLFILNKAQGRDLYTTADCITYTSVNGAAENDLTLNNRLHEANWIVHVGGQYVAYGVKVDGGLSADTYGTASSADLITWVQETPDAPQFFDIRYFGGAYLGIALDTSGGGSITSDIVEVWRSTDFITWTKQTLPNALVGSSYEKVAVESGQYILMSNSQVWQSTNGITFIEHTLKYNTIPFVVNARGLEPRLTLDAPPANIKMQTSSIDQFGGKILEWANGLDNSPTLRYPTTNPADETVGFTGVSSISGTGIADNGFSLTNTTAHAGFYLHKLGTRYFEVTIQGHDGTLNADIGVSAPAANYFTGLGITRVQLASGGGGSVISTTSGDLPVTYTMAIGDVIGVLVNFILATVEIKVNNATLATIPNIATSVLWTQLIEASNSNLLLNIGQDPFVYTIAGTVAWADEEI